MQITAQYNKKTLVVFAIVLLIGSLAGARSTYEEIRRMQPSGKDIKNGNQTQLLSSATPAKISPRTPAWRKHFPLLVEGEASGKVLSPIRALCIAEPSDLARICGETMEVGQN